jgi:hypothetical protein
MAGIEKDEVPTLPVSCFATGLPIPEKDAEQHGVLLVFLAAPETPFGAAMLSTAIEGRALAIVNGAITKDAKKISLTLAREEPGGKFMAFGYRTLETFDGIGADNNEENDYPYGY